MDHAEEALSWLERYLQLLEDGTLRVESLLDDEGQRLPAPIRDRARVIHLFASKPPYMVGPSPSRPSILFFASYPPHIVLG